MTNKFYLPKDLAEDWNVSVQTIIRLITDKKLPAVKVGHQWRIMYEDADKYLEENRSIKND